MKVDDDAVDDLLERESFAKEWWRREMLSTSFRRLTKSLEILK